MILTFRCTTSHATDWWRAQFQSPPRPPGVNYEIIGWDSLTLKVRITPLSQEARDVQWYETLLLQHFYSFQKLEGMNSLTYGKEEGE